MDECDEDVLTLQGAHPSSFFESYCSQASTTFPSWKRLKAIIGSSKLPLAIKDWVRLKLRETSAQRTVFESRYGTDFATFRQAWEQGQIADKHSYDVEHDYWEWEAVITDEEQLRQMLESLP